MNIPNNRRRWGNAFFATFLFLVGGILAFSAEKIISKLHFGIFGWVIVLLITFISFAFLSDLALRRAGRVLGSVVRPSLPDQEPPRRFFLTGYSPLKSNPSAQEVLQRAQEMAHEDLRANVQTVTKKDLPSLGSWHQNARAVLHHARVLEVILILRPDDNDKQFEKFVDFLKVCLRKAGNDKVIIKQIHFPNDPNRQFQMLGRTGCYEKPSYDDYEYVYEGFREGLKQLRQLAGNWSEEDVCIDVTPGFKPYSIAAAVITFNQRLKFSYVTTNGELRFYDAEITFHA